MVDVNRIKEYAHARKVHSAIGTTSANENHIPDIMSEISLKRLIEGGAAILQIDNKNQHKEKAGKRLKIPLVKNILRVEVPSYVILARENIHEEHRPCAIIIAIEPCHPQVEQSIVPIITKAI